MHETPIQTFTSHIEGKNAKVRIFADRIEWEKQRAFSAGKLTAGVMTAGASLLATGVKHGDAGTEMIPIKSISSVTTKRDGLINSKVSIITSGNTIDFRVSHSEAAGVADTLKRLILGTHPSQQSPEAPVSAPHDEQASPSSAPSSPPNPQEQLQKVADLLAAGLITQDEAATKRAAILDGL